MANLTTDLTFGPRFPIEQDNDYESEAVRFRGGDSQGWSWGDGTNLRTWTLVFDLDDAEYDALLAYVAARKGSQEKHFMNLIQTGETNIPIRFPDGRFRSSYRTGRTRRVELRVWETN